MKSRFGSLSAIASLIVCVLLCSPLSAQNTAALSGTVQDTTGAVLPGADVKLTNVGQGTVRNTITNETGIYRFSFLPAGQYTIEVSLPGFKLIRREVALDVAQNALMNFGLEVGDLSQDVSVSTQVGMVKTETAEMGAIIDNRHVVEVPLNGRTFYSLAPLTPNVVAPPITGGNSFRGGFNVSGQSEVNNNFLLNGFIDDDTTVIVPGFRPSVDSIEEFNILTGVYSAQYGYASGGQVIMTQKSGTNNFHGSLFEYLRNSAMDASNFFQLPGLKPSLKRNQFGGTIGGPIVKNKTFFFYSYEGLRSSNAFIGIDTIPTDAMKAGDFSATGKTIIDPNTGLPFPGNIIPQNRFHPIAVDILSYFPSPQRPTAAGTLPTNNYTFSGTRTEFFNESSLKIDHTFSAKDSAYATGNYYFDQSFEPGPSTSTCGAVPLPNLACDFIKKDELWGISETHVFSATMVNEARAGFIYSKQPAYSRVAQRLDFWKKYGIDPTITRVGGIPNGGLPGVTITGFQGISGGAFDRHDPHYQFADIFSWTHGRHTVKTGFEFYRIQTNNANTGSSLGSVSFTNTSAGPTTGLGFADLLLGLPTTTGTQPYTNKIYLRTFNLSTFVQDDFKVTPRLTLNVGLRWEVNEPTKDVAHHERTFDPVKGIPVIEGNTPYLQFQPGGYSDHVINWDWHDFAPRLGISWQPSADGKTVVRLGGGTFLNILQAYRMGNINGAYPITYTFTSSKTQPITLSNPFPASNAVASNNATGADPHFRNARTYEWSVGVQRELASDLVFEMSYYGSHSSHMNLTGNINQPRPGPGTPAEVNARRPYPQYGSIMMYTWGGNANYDSLVLSFKKRYSNGLSFLSSYTWGKAIDDAGTSVSCNCGAGPTDELNLRTARGPSSFDINHRIIFSPVYELPFGKGKQHLTQGPAAMILGGWQLSSQFSKQTGFKLTPTISGNYSNSGGTTDRPDMIHNPNSNAPHTVQQWFDTSAFPLRPANGQTGATYSFGNAGKGVITGPGLLQFDLSIVRNFRVRESIKAQFRAEFFNLPNHPNFGDPNVTAGTTAFGTIITARDPRQTQLALRLLF